MTHIALLGDSVIDNKAYVGNGPDVLAQLQSIIPDNWQATKCAVDGAAVSDINQQLQSLPSDASHIVISVGGNDALRETGVLDAPARSVSDALLKLAAIRDRFEEEYRRMLDSVTTRQLPIVVCTIYDPRFPDAERRKIGALGLSIINDRITREAFSRGLDLLDLRVMFDHDADFANAIEPSVQGGMKLAQAILRFAAGPHGQTRVIR